MLPVFLLLLSLFTGVGAHAVPAERQISVNGHCLHMVVPDRGAVVVTAVALEPDPGLAAKKAAEQYQKLREAVQTLKLQNLEMQTIEYTVNEQREWQKDREVSRGYRARMGLQVATSDIARLGEVISAAAKNGVRDVGGLTTFMSQQKQKQERESCLVEAVQNARKKADAMSQAAGARTGKVMAIQEDSMQPPPPEQPMMMAMSGKAKGMEADMPVPQIESKAESIAVDVRVQFELLGGT